MSEEAGGDGRDNDGDADDGRDNDGDGDDGRDNGGDGDGHASQLPTFPANTKHSKSYCFKHNMILNITILSGVCQGFLRGLPSCTIS